MRHKSIADKAIFYCALLFMASTGLLIYLGNRNILYFIQLMSASALIGGIADWYGVTSVYGKPLGIGFKTEVVVKERQKLVKGIRSFICDQILSEKNISEKLGQFHLIERFLKLLRKDGEQQDAPIDWLVNMISSILWRTMASIDSREIGLHIGSLFNEIFSANKPVKDVVDILKGSLNEKKVMVLINAASPELLKLSDNQALKNILYETIERTLTGYARDKTARNLLNILFQEQIKDSMMVRFNSFLYEFVKNPQHQSKRMLTEKILQAIDQLERNQELVAELDRRLALWLEQGQVGKLIAGQFDKIREEKFSKVENFHNYLRPLALNFLNNLEKDKVRIDEWEKILLDKLNKIIAANHEKIGDFLEYNINRLNDAQLVTFIRDNTEADFQLIRLNGMFFGILVSVLIFSAKLAMGLL